MAQIPRSELRPETLAALRPIVKAATSGHAMPLPGFTEYFLSIRNTWIGAVGWLIEGTEGRVMVRCVTAWTVGGAAKGVRWLAAELPAKLDLPCCLVRLGVPLLEDPVLCQNSAQPAATIKLRSRNQAKLQHANGLRGGHEHLTAEAPIGGAVACPSSLSLVGTLSISGGTVRRRGLLVRLYRVASKNTNGLKIHVPGRFGLEVPRLGSPREARILGRYGVAADGPGPEPPLAVWTADVPLLPDLTVTPSAGSPVRTRPPQT